MSYGRMRMLHGLFVWLVFLMAVEGCHTQSPASLASMPCTISTPDIPNFRVYDQSMERSPDATINAVEIACEGYRPWKYIVIHHSATQDGNVASFDRAHRDRGFDELGYHFLINNGHGGQDGSIEATRRWRYQKWGAHTGGTEGNEYNNYGIGICLVGDFTDCFPSERQITSLQNTVRYLMGAYRIRPENVIAHRDGPHSSTVCPGEKLYEHLQSMLRPERARLSEAWNPHRIVH